MKRIALVGAPLVLVVAGAGVFLAARGQKAEPEPIADWPRSSASASASASAVASGHAPSPTSSALPPSFGERLEALWRKTATRKHPEPLDVDGDGFGDMVATGCDGEDGRKGGAALVFLGTANGLSTKPVRIERPEGFYEREYGGSNQCFHKIYGATDVDLDGKSDLFLHGYILRGAHPFAAGALTPTKTPIHLTGDVNGDGYDDEVTAGLFADPSKPLMVDQSFGGPDGGRAEWPNPGSDGSADARFVGDVDGDGFGDYSIGSQIYRGSAKGLIESPPISVNFGNTVIRLGDVNGDGLMDVMGTQATWGRVAFGTRVDGVFSFTVTEESIAVVNVVLKEPVVANDFNHDGLSDFVVADPANKSLVVYLGSKTGPTKSQTITADDGPARFPTDMFAGSP